MNSEHQKAAEAAMGDSIPSKAARAEPVAAADSSIHDSDDSINEVLKPKPFAFLKNPRFYLVLLLGQAIAGCMVGTNTFTQLLANNNFSIPAFQSFFNYILLNLTYTVFTIYKYGFRRFGKMLYQDGWKYFILAFFDVQGNYFVVLAYRYTTILSAQLISFWAIVLVVGISFSFLKVRYHWSQIIGILICIGGMGVLMYSDYQRGSRISGGVPDEVKGNLFMFVSATSYGISNVLEEFLVSKSPLYEVVGQIGFWGFFINGTQAAIFDRQQFKTATWNSRNGGYFTGFTLFMFTFYSLVPVLLRMASAAFFNISLLTSNFWVVVIGIRIFHLTVTWLYGIAFTMIMIGLIIYYTLSNILGESHKPWLGLHQEHGISGVGTAKKKIQNQHAHDSQA